MLSYVDIMINKDKKVHDTEFTAACRSHLHLRRRDVKHSTLIYANAPSVFYRYKQWCVE